MLTFHFSSASPVWAIQLDASTANGRLVEQLISFTSLWAAFQLFDPSLCVGSMALGHLHPTPQLTRQLSSATERLIEVLGVEKGDWV